MNKHPTEAGWYWFKEKANGPWECLLLKPFSKDEPGIGFWEESTGNWISINETFTAQWGPKIEEPKGE
jgi:hypothetical protein